MAVISQGSTAGQQTVTGTLSDIAERARELPTPAIIVVGAVAGLQAQLDWFHSGIMPRATGASASVFTEHIYAVSA